MDGSSHMSQVPVATEVNLKTFKLLSCFLLLNLRIKRLVFLILVVSGGEVEWSIGVEHSRVLEWCIHE
ncbi:hypothetical protein Bca4012_102059 [Brassica carinata]